MRVGDNFVRLILIFFVNFFIILFLFTFLIILMLNVKQY